MLSSFSYSPAEVKKIDQIQFGILSAENIVRIIFFFSKKFFVLFGFCVVEAHASITNLFWTILLVWITKRTTKSQQAYARIATRFFSKRFSNI